MKVKLDTFDNYTLFVDTTNNFCYIALYKVAMLINEIKIPVNKNVTDIIVDAINTLLINSKVKQSDLTHMCVNLGPGTFTGVKVGVVVAKAWRMSNKNLEIRTTNSLLLQCKSLPAVSVIDAKSNKFYIAVYDFVGKAIIEPKCVAKEEMESICNTYKDYPVYKDLVDKMYENYPKYLGCTQVVKDFENFDPIYLKDPV